MANGKLTSAGLVLLAAIAAVVLAPARDAVAAQPYHCICDGKDKRFLASTRYCEHQHNVKSCSREQWRKTYAKACRQMGCRLAPLR